MYAVICRINGKGTAVNQDTAVCSTIVPNTHKMFLKQQMRWYMEQSASDLIAVAMTGERDPDYPTVCRAAQCLAEEMDAALPQGKPLILILEHDMAKVLGMAMRSVLSGRRKVICIVKACVIISCRCWVHSNNR